jgi:hypothetical protein
MKALSVRQPWAQLIAQGDKTVEVRSRPWSYRGQLVICATARPIELDDDGKPLPVGCTVAIVDMVDCRPLRPDDAAPACMDGNYGDFTKDECAGKWAWVLSNSRMVENVPVKGQLQPWDWKGKPL